MSNYSFQVLWIRPNGISTDVTARCILDRCGSLNRGVAASDDLFAFVSGDLTLEFNNQDNFFSDDLKSDPLDLGKLQSIRSLIQVDVTRDGQRQFRGFVLPQAIKLDRMQKTAAVTVLGPMRLIDGVSAENLARVFPVNLLVAAPGAIKDSTSLILSVDVPLLVGDSIGIGVEDTLTSVVVGYNSLTKTVNVAEGFSRPVAAGEVVTCLTPYPRNQDMLNLAIALFGLGGITNYDVEFTGLVGSRPFLTSFNALGTSGVGELRGIKQAQRAVPGQNSLVASFQVPNATTAVETAATTPFSGFTPVAGSPVTLLLDGVKYEGGGWHDFADQGGLNGMGGGAGEPVEGLLTANVFRKPADTISVSGGTGSFSHTTIRRTFDVVRTIGGQTFLYELFFTQSVIDVNDPGKGTIPDYETGGRNFTSYLKRYTTANGGLTWVTDTTFVPSFAAPGLVVTIPAAKTYKYKVVAFGAGGSAIAASIEATTAVGPDQNLGNGPRAITVTWGAVAGAALYAVYRTQVGNTEAVGRVATIGGLVFVDNLPTVIGTDTPNPINQLLLGASTTFAGTGGAIYDWKLSARPFLQGAGYNHVLYFSHWVGDLGVGLGVADLRNTRLTINGGAPVAQTTLHFNAAGCKAIFTRPFSAYAAGTAKVDFYYWDLSSGVPAIVHAEDTGVAHTVTPGHATYNTGINPLVRTFKWNQIDGDGCRVFGLFTNPTSGTGYLIMAPGNSSFGTSFESQFLVEFQGTINADSVMRFNSSSGAGAAGDRQVCSNLGFGTVSGGGGNPFVFQNDSCHIATWTVSIGGVGGQKVLVGYAANQWFIASRYHTGFLSYADFTGMSASKALQEIAFVLNAFVNVDWMAGAPDPFGTFLSRDLPAPVAPKLLANLNGSKPSGQYQDCILNMEYDRAWSQCAPFVELKGSTDQVVATSGIDDAKQQGMSVEAKFVETTDLAQTIADTLFVYYGPGWPISQAPLVTPTSVGAFTAYSYVVVATFGINPLLNIQAISEIGSTNNAAVTLTPISKIIVTYSGISGATHYHVYRSFSQGAGNSGLLGLMVSTAGVATFNDIGNAPITLGAPPSRLRQPRQGAMIEVVDDQTIYAARGEVQFPDLLGHTDLGEPTANPVVPPDPTKPPRWWIENIDYNPTEPIIRLQVVEKDVPA